MTPVVVVGHVANEITLTYDDAVSNVGGSAIYFAIAAGLVTRGYLSADERQVNLGLLVVALGLLTRYCDYFWDTGSQAAFFMVGGALLLALALGLERVRRSLLAGMDDPALPPPPATGATEVL